MSERRVKRRTRQATGTMVARLVFHFASSEEAQAMTNLIEEIFKPEVQPKKGQDDLR